MLLETHRKRRRTGGGAAFTVADLPRPPRRTQQQQLQTPQVPTTTTTPTFQRQQTALTATRRLTPAVAEEEKQDEPTTAMTAMRWPHALTTMATATGLAPAPPRLVDRRVLLSRASRMQLLLMERLRCVDLRRARRGELLDEITRLKKIVAELQSDIDATTRNLEQLEQLVQRLQQISFSGASAPAETVAGGRTLDGLPLPPSTRLAPGTILWTNPAFASSSGQLSQAAKEDARRASANAPGGCRFASSHRP